MPDDPQVIEDLEKEVLLEEKRREGKLKRENDNVPRSGVDYKPRSEEIIISETETPVEET